jgi:endonuclease YncB( thermonuclease family)
VEALLASLKNSELLAGAFVVAIIVLGVVLPRMGRRFRATRRRRKFQMVQEGRSSRPALKRKRNPTTVAMPRSWLRSPLWLLVLAIGLAIGFKLQPELVGANITLSGAVTHVRDGDTIEVAGTPVRLNGLNCDELGTPLGDRAKRVMQTLAAGQAVSCTLNGDQTFDREVGRCQLGDGRDLGEVMIEGGACGRCARHDPLRKYAAAVAKAGPFPGDYPSYCWWLW